MLNSVNYSIVSSKHRHPDSGTYQSYGIKATCASQVLDTVYDITTNYSQIETLHGILNEQQVSHCHFREVIEDFLARL